MSAADVVAVMPPRPPPLLLTSVSVADAAAAVLGCDYWDYALSRLRCCAPCDDITRPFTACVKARVERTGVTCPALCCRDAAATAAARDGAVGDNLMCEATALRLDAV